MHLSLFLLPKRTADFALAPWCSCQDVCHSEDSLSLGQLFSRLMICPEYFCGCLSVFGHSVRILFPPPSLLPGVLNDDNATKAPHSGCHQTP